jgi:hypothetical protein
MPKFEPSRNYVNGQAIFDSNPVEISGNVFISGTLSASAINGGGGGGSTPPGGPNTSIQYNNAGVFGGSTNFTWNNATSTVAINGDLSGSGNISGSAFYGDGSNLTNLPSAAITTYNNPGDNRIITSVNATTVQGEANLSFDSSNVLRLTGTLDHLGSTTQVGNYNQVGDYTLTGAVYQLGEINLDGPFFQSGTHVLTGAFNHLGTSSQTGDYNQVGDYILTGAFNHLGASSQTGDYVQIGDYTLTGAFNHLGTSSHSGDYVQIGDYILTGNFDHLGTKNHTGNYNQVGDYELTGAIYQLGEINLTGPFTQDGDYTLTGAFNHSGSTLHIGDTVQTGSYTVTGSVSINGPLELGGGLQFGSSFATASLSANTDNLLIPNLENSILVRLDAAPSNYSLTGIVVPDNTKTFFFSVFNVGTRNITFKDDDVGSTADNRFLLGADVVIQGGEGITLIYDPVDTRWRSPGKNI